MMKIKKIIVGVFLLWIGGILITACENDLQDTSTIEVQDPLLEVAEFSGQLASGVDFTLGNRRGGRPEGASYGGGRPGGMGKGGGRPGSGYGSGEGDGNLRYNNDPDLLAISIADRVGERMNFWMFASQGADVKHYSSEGAQIDLELNERPKRGFWSDDDAPKAAKTIIDFGDEFSMNRGNLSLVISGVIRIDRSFSNNELSEQITFENVVLNGTNVEGVKMSTRSFDSETGQGEMVQSVINGKITFVDGSVATWNSTKHRNVSIEFNEDGGRPLSGNTSSSSEIIVEKTDGSLIYSHTTLAPIISDISCAARGRGMRPSGGSVKTVYGENTIEVDFGDGSCSSSISVKINGEEKVIGG